MKRVAYVRMGWFPVEYSAVSRITGDAIARVAPAQGPLARALGTWYVKRPGHELAFFATLAQARAFVDAWDAGETGAS